MNRSICDKCKSKIASLLCHQCSYHYCDQCDVSAHKTESKKNHRRVLIAKQQTVTFKNSSSSNLYNRSNPKFHSPVQNNSKIGIFWDLHNSKLDSKILDETVKSLTARFHLSVKIKIYGNRYSSLFAQVKSSDYEFRMETGKSELSLLISDLEISSKSLGKILIISPRAHVFKSEIMNLKLNNLRIIASPNDLNETSAGSYLANADFKIKNGCKETVSSSFQPNEIEYSFQVAILKYLKELAYEGKIIHEINEIKKKLAFHLGVPLNYVQELLNFSCDSGKILQKTKKIGKFELSLVSLNVQTLTAKVLLWVLRSLKKDEMISNEKAIQSRLKEAFELKIESNVLTEFIEKTVSQPNTSPGSEIFSLFSSQNKENKKNFFFYKKTVKNFGSSLENLVVYPVNEEWISYDQYIKSGDVFQMKNTVEWKAFLDHFNKFYSGEYSEEKALSGGRYGCALYLKNYCETLKHSSIGKLNYIIQLAIDEDILKYHRSLLVLSSEFDKKCKENKKALLNLKKNLVQLVSDSNGGVSLAQIPSLLENKNFSENFISNLGYAKIKDLVEDIPDLELTMIGRNHPFVKLLDLPKASFDNLLEFILAELEMAGGALSADDVEVKVSEKFGYGLLWSSVDVKSFEGFIQECAEVLCYDQKLICKRSDNFYSYACSTNSDEANQQNDVDFFDNGEGIDDEVQLRFLEDLLEVR